MKEWVDGDIYTTMGRTRQFSFPNPRDRVLALLDLAAESRIAGMTVERVFDVKTYTRA